MIRGPPWAGLLHRHGPWSALAGVDHTSRTTSRAPLLPNQPPGEPVRTNSESIDTDRGDQRRFRSSGESHPTYRRSSCLLPKRFSQGVPSFVSSHQRAKQAWIWFPVSIEWRSPSVGLIPSIIAGRRELAWGRWRSLARPGCGARRCRRTDAAKAAAARARAACPSPKTGTAQERAEVEVLAAELDSALPLPAK
jgi:hypothetical protein